MASLNNFIKSTDGLVEFEEIFNQIDEKSHSQHTLVVYLDEIKSIWSEVKNNYAVALDSIDRKDSSDSKTVAMTATSNVSLVAIKQKY